MRSGLKQSQAKSGATPVTVTVIKPADSKPLRNREGVCRDGSQETCLQPETDLRGVGMGKWTLHKSLDPSRAGIFVSTGGGSVRFFSFVIAIMFVLGVPNLSLAQESSEEDSSEVSDDYEEVSEEETPEIEVIISASRRPQEVGRVGASHTVITADQIEERGHFSVQEVLEEVPGLEVSTTGVEGHQTSVFLRGGTSQQTAVYIDGIRANSPSSGRFDLSNVPVDGIERIEVVRGPQSAVGGSDSMGGSIHIFTKRGRGKTNVKTRFEGGSRKTARGALDFSGSEDFLDWNVSSSYSVTDGYSAASEHRGNTEQDGFRNRVLGARIGTDKLGRLELTGRYTSSSTEIDNGPNSENLEDFVTRQNVQASLSHVYEYTDAIKHRARIGVAEERLEDMGLGGAFARISHFRNISGDFQMEFDHEQWHEAWGVQVLREEDRNKAMDYTTTVGLFGESSFDLPYGGSLLGGVRADNRRILQKDLGSVLTYRSTIIQPLGNSSLTVRGAYGTGFHYPTFFDLSPSVGGNPALLPESSRAADAGLIWNSRDKHTRLEATLFQTDYTNLIQWAPIDPMDPFSLWAPANVGRARIRGAEISLQQTRGRINRTFSYTRLDARDLDTDTALPKRPRDKVTAHVAVDLGNASRSVVVFGSVTGVFGREQSIFDIDVPLDYYTADLGVRGEVVKGLSLALRIKNVGDRSYEEVPGYMSPRRAVFVSGTMDWNQIGKLF